MKQTDNFQFVQLLTDGKLDIFCGIAGSKVMLLAIFLHEKNSNDYSTQTQENYILENMGFHDTMVISMYSFHCRDYRQKNK